ncbi:hypothetical protein JCM3770_005940 [Rhodotorula araucariae]
MQVRPDVAGVPSPKQQRVFVQLDSLNTLIATNAPAQRSKAREFFSNALGAVFDLGAEAADRLDGVPVVSDWLPAAKAVFWLGVVYFHRREAREACRSFGELLADGYSVSVQLGLGDNTYARSVMDECHRQRVPCGGVRKLWYETKNAFGRENILGQIKELTDSLTTRAPLDAPKPPPDPFLGRTNELALLASQLRDRSVLVHGVLGIGKTSLVRKALQDVYPDHRKVALRCDEIKSVEKLERELLRVWPMRPLDGDDTTIALRLALRERSTVVVLENVGRLWVRDTDGLEELLQSLMALANVTFLLTALDEGLYNALAGSDVAPMPLNPLNDADRRALFVHFAPQHQADPQLDAFLIAIGGQPLVVRDEALKSHSHTSLQSMLNAWAEKTRGVRLAQNSQNLATSVDLSLEQIRHVRTASELAVLLARLPYGLDVVERLPQPLLGEAITALTSATGLAAFGSPTLRLVPPVRECLERNPGLLKTPLAPFLVDAVVASYAHEMQGYLKDMRWRRCDQPLVTPKSADWPSLPHVVELAVECGSKQLGKLAKAVQELLETLPLPGELADFVNATQGELEELFGKVVELLAVKNRPTSLSALASSSLALFSPSRQIAAFRDWPGGALINKSWRASPGAWIERQVLGPSAGKRLEMLLRFQLAKWSGTECELAQAARELEALGSPSLLGWAAYERSVALVHQLLAPKAPASLKDVHLHAKLFYPEAPHKTVSEEAMHVEKSPRPKTLREEKLVEKLFAALNEAEEFANEAHNRLLLGFTLTRRAGLERFFSRRSYRYPDSEKHLLTSAEQAHKLFAKEEDADGLVMLIRYLQTCDVAATPEYEQPGEKTASFKLFHEIVHSLRELHPPEAYLRAVQDCLGLDDKDVGLPARAPAAPRSHAASSA